LLWRAVLAFLGVRVLKPRPWLLNSTAGHTRTHMIRCCPNRTPMKEDTITLTTATAAQTPMPAQATLTGGRLIHIAKLRTLSAPRRTGYGWCPRSGDLLTTRWHRFAFTRMDALATCRAILCRLAFASGPGLGTPGAAYFATETATENAPWFCATSREMPHILKTARDGKGTQNTRDTIVLALGDRGSGVQISPLRPLFRDAEPRLYSKGVVA
jgi:hypothetical protein